MSVFTKIIDWLAGRSQVTETSNDARPLSRKQSAVTPIIGASTYGTPQWTPKDYGILAREGYQKSSDVYACIQQIITAAKYVKWQPTKTDADGNEIGTQDPKLQKLLRRPNPWQSWPQLIEQILGYVELSGNFYIEGVWALDPSATPGNSPVRGKDLPLELYAHRPDRMRIIPVGGRLGEQDWNQGIIDRANRREVVGNQASPVSAYEYNVAGQRLLFNDPNVICHGRLFNPLNDWYGMSPIEAASYSIDASNEARMYQKAFLQNGVRLSGALVAPADVEFTKEQTDALRMELQQKNGGPANGGGILILGGGLDWKEMGQTSADAELLLTRMADKRDIASAFGVPSMLIGDEQAKTYANYQEARKALYQDTVLPLLGLVRDELNRWLALDDSATYFGFDTTSIDALQESKNGQMERLVMGVKNAIMSVNEARQELGGKRDPDGDTLLVPSLTVTLDSLVNPPDPEPDPMDPNEPNESNDPQDAVGSKPKPGKSSGKKAA